MNICDSNARVVISEKLSDLLTGCPKIAVIVSIVKMTKVCFSFTGARIQGNTKHREKMPFINAR